MRHPHIRLAALATLSLVAACGDATGPMRFGRRPMPVGAPTLDIIVDRMAEDSSSADFTVTPTGGVFVIGPHAISFPAHSICDPRTSTYGQGEWDQPCDVLAEPIQIHAEVRNQDGRSWVDFTPSLRFVPADSSNRYVWI